MQYSLTSYDPIVLELDKPPVPSELIAQEIDRLLEEKSEYPTEDPRPIKFGDYVVLTSRNALLDGSPAPRFQMTKGFYRVNGREMPMAFDKELIGMLPGEARHIEVSIGPRLLDGDVGSLLSIDVVVEELLRRVSPELTDDYIGENFPPAKNLESFRKEVAKSFKPNPIPKSDPHFEYLVLGALADRLAERVRDADVPAGDNLANYRTTCAIDALADHRGISVSDDELTELIPAPTEAERRAIREDFEKRGLADELRLNVRREKTLAWLIENSSINYKEE